MIRTTYLDRICYRPGCDDSECRVLLPEGVRIGERATYPLRESGILLHRHSTRMSHIRNFSLPTFHLDISHPAPSPDMSHPALDAGWERRAFQLPRSDISGSSDSAYPESFAAILHSAVVFSWSFPIFATDILRYFALDIWCLNPQTLLVTHQL